jgi:hypothetical protein
MLNTPETIEALDKYSPISRPLHDILTSCTDPNPDGRHSSLEVVELAHRHVEKRFRSLEENLGLGSDSFLLQVFFKIAEGLDKYTYLETHTSFLPRQKLLIRLRMLLDDGAQRSYQENSKSLHIAVLLGHEEKLQDLLLRSQNPDEAWPNSSWTPLHLAAQTGQLNMVEHLLPSAKDVHAKDAGGYTAMDYGKRKGYNDIVRAIQGPISGLIEGLGALQSGYNAAAVAAHGVGVGASNSANASSFSTILKEYNAQMERRMLENMEWQTQNPWMSSRRDATD